MKNTVSLKLNGDVMLSDFAKVLNHLSTLIDELTSEICVKEDIEWEIVKLESGSATTVIAAISADQSAIERIIQAYELIGQSISDNKPIPFNETIASEARSITNVINGKVKSVEFFTDDYKAIIEKSVEAQIQEQESDFSFGTVTGVVETLSKRGRMRFVLYDTLFDKAVNCYLAKDQENLMLDAWDKKILVAGKVSREPKTGRPYQVKDINYVEQKISSPPGSFFRAKGIVKWQEGDELPEAVIRRYRNDQ